MPNCAKVLQPVNSLLKGNPSKTRILIWDKQNAAFYEAEAILCYATLLAYPMHGAETSLPPSSYMLLTQLEVPFCNKHKMEL